MFFLYPSRISVLSHWLKVNEFIEYKLSLTYKVLMTSKPSYLYNLMSVQLPRSTSPNLLSPFLAHQPSPHWKSQIAHLVMHHPVSGINSQILSFSLASHVSTHLLIHLSTHLCHHHHSHHPSLLHSFTPGSKPTFSTNPSHRTFLLPTGLPHYNGTGQDLSRSSFYF